jgi:hypothetical protein
MQNNETNLIVPANRLHFLIARGPGCKLRGPEFDSQLYQIFCIAVGLERGPFSLVRINGEPLERNISESGLEN